MDVNIPFTVNIVNTGHLYWHLCIHIVFPSVVNTSQSHHTPPCPHCEHTPPPVLLAVCGLLCYNVFGGALVLLELSDKLKA